jgi:hypothetical protein
MDDIVPGSPLVRWSDRVQPRAIAAFYGELLGFGEEYACGETRSEAFSTLLGQPAGSRCRFVVLKQPGPSFGMIGLFELSEPAPPAPANPGVSVARGDVLLVFYLARLDPFVARVQSLDGRLLVPPVDLMSLRSAQRELVACDPDGVRLNIIERDPAQAQRLTGPGRVF